jgi:UTP:GlnB (protein PII) uridylyltransferase
MANRRLTADELLKANEVLVDVRAKLKELAGDDRDLLFAYRRKVFKELIYDERGKPMQRRALKKKKWVQQEGRCAHCNEEMPVAYSELDRFNAADGYTVENTELVHDQCHRERQAAKRYT